MAKEITVIYQPPVPHRCPIPDRGNYTSMNIGLCIRCNECGSSWVLSESDLNKPIWRPLLPWPFDRRQRKALKKRAGNG